MRFSLIASIRFFLCALCLSGAAFFTHTFAQSIDSEEQLMLKLINDYRAQNGLPALKISIALTKAGDWMGADMIAKNYFSHTDSLGRDPFVRMTAFGYGYGGTRGENLAAGYGDAASTFNQWRNSPGHNAAMLHSAFRVLGISRVYGASSTYKWYWTTDFGSFVDATFEDGGTPGTPVRAVNSASYFQTIAPDGIASIFGTGLATTTNSATATPLPTSLSSVQVTVNDQLAQLFYISPTQINFVVPSSTQPGAATIKVLGQTSIVGSGTATVEAVSPSLFTVSANGQGTAAAQVTADGVSFQPVAETTGAARPVSVGTATKPNYLVLYGTGLRRRSSLSAVRVTIGGISLAVDYLGAHPRLAGLDQINVKLPQELRGRGMVDVTVTIDGKVSNVVKVNIGN